MVQALPPLVGAVHGQEQRPKQHPLALCCDGAGGLCCCSSAGCACSRRQWYDKYFAYNMAVGMEDYEVAVQPVKQLLFSQLLTSLPQQQQQQQQLQQQSTDKPSSSSSSSPGAMHALLEVGIGTGGASRAPSSAVVRLVARCSLVCTHKQAAAHHTCLLVWTMCTPHSHGSST